MKYQDFENKLSDMFADASEQVDIALLLEGIHGEKPRKKAMAWRWGLLFAVLAVVGTVGLNYVIVNNHQPTRPISNSQMLVTPQEEARSRVVTAEEPTTADQVSTINSELQSAAHSPSIKSTVNAVALRSPSNITGAGSIARSFAASTTSIPEHPESADVQSTVVQLAQASRSKQQTAAEQKLVPQTTTSVNTAASTDRLMEKVTMLGRSYVEVAALGGRQMPQKGAVECPSFKKSLEWHLDLIPELGVIAPLKSLTARSAQDPEVFDMRSQDETPLEGLQAALYARVRVGAAPYYLKVGASYTRISERMNLDINYIERDTTIGIISITESQNGDTLTIVQGEIITETEYSRKSTDHYYLHMIDIPVALGYSKPLGGGWRLGGEVGAQFNIGLSSKGKLLETADSYTQLPATGRFAPSLGLSFFGGLTLEKAVGSRSSIYLSPRFRYFPSSFTPESYNINQEYQFVGLHAGYIYSF